MQETLLAARLVGRRVPGAVIGGASWLVGILKHKLVDHLRLSLRERPPAGPQADDIAGLFDGRRPLEGVAVEVGRRPAGTRGRRGIPGRPRPLPVQAPVAHAHLFWLREAEGIDTAELCRAAGGDGGKRVGNAAPGTVRPARVPEASLVRRVGGPMKLLAGAATGADPHVPRRGAALSRAMDQRRRLGPRPRYESTSGFARRAGATAGSSPSFAASSRLTGRTCSGCSSARSRATRGNASGRIWLAAPPPGDPSPLWKAAVTGDAMYLYQRTCRYGTLKPLRSSTSRSWAWPCAPGTRSGTLSSCGSVKTDGRCSGSGGRKRSSDHLSTSAT